MTRRHLTLPLLALLVAAAGCAGAPVTGGDERTVVAGLREALRIGAERAIARSAVVDGYLANELIRITMPPELDRMAGTLRRIGLGDKVDALEKAMNRAAEEAAGEARELLVREILALSFGDALGILHGGPTAATDYLRARTSEELRRRFHEIVETKMELVGLARLYNELSDLYARLPLVSRPVFDLDAYVTDKALAGLFLVLAEEEARIRADPLARTTELLRRVFGRLLSAGGPAGP